MVPYFVSIFSGFAVLLVSLACLYFTLLWLSPHPIAASSSEKQYRSAASPIIPLPLPNLVGQPASVDLSVIIPAFNEVTRLPSMLSVTINHLSSPVCRGRSYEILIVDDGSSDNTSGTALRLSQEHSNSDIRTVKLDKNLGKGGAVRHGMLHARGRRLLMVDADGASRFEDLEVLWVEMEKLAPNDQAAIIVGSRAHLVDTEAVVKRSFLRNVAMYGLHVVLRVVGVGHIRDTQCGFKLFTRAAAQQIFPFQHLTGWIFDVEILLIAKELRIPVAEVPITWEEVPASKLKLVRDSIMMFTDLMLLRLNQSLGLWTVKPRKHKSE